MPGPCCMPKKTITKNAVVVIFSAVAAFASAGCLKTGAGDGKAPSFDAAASRFDGAKPAGRIESEEITESSGLAVSRCQEGVLWTHNDSGDGPYIFAMDEQGKPRGTWKVQNASATDWEDIAIFKDASGKCFLLIGDTGNSKKEPRSEHTIYRVPEPEVTPDAAGTTRKQALETAAAEAITFSYPDQPQDAETLLVQPQTGDIYVLTKHREKPSGVYRIKPEFGGPPVQAVKLTDVSVPAIPNGLLTGGDIAADGKHVILCDYFAAYEFELPSGAANFDEVWKRKPAVVDIGDRKQGEAVAYSADGDVIFATSEGKREPIMSAVRRK